jgi:hypothetical protein
VTDLGNEVAQSRMRTARAALLIAAIAPALVACSQQNPSWQSLLAARIRDQPPAYEVESRADGSLVVHRPKLPNVAVDVDAIARFCQRGPKDCNYATEQMLLSLDK